MHQTIFQLQCFVLLNNHQYNYNITNYFLSIQSPQFITCLPDGTPWWVRPHLDITGRFRGGEPCFGDFQSNWIPILYPNTIQLIPSFCRKNGLSLLHLVPEILGPKVGLIFFTKMYYLTDFKHFVSILFSPSF